MSDLESFSEGLVDKWPDGLTELTLTADWLTEVTRLVNLSFCCAVGGGGGAGKPEVTLLVGTTFLAGGLFRGMLGNMLGPACPHFVLRVRNVILILIGDFFYIYFLINFCLSGAMPCHAM